MHNSPELISLVPSLFGPLKFLHLQAVGLVVTFCLYGSLHPSKQFNSFVGTGVRGLNQC